MEIWFLLKKFITFFIEPLGVVLTLFAIGIYFLFADKKSSSKVFILLAFGLLTLFSYKPFSNLLVENLENQYSKYDYNQETSYIHVLGSGHNTDSSQPISSKVCNSGVKRVLEGVIIQMKNPNSKLIFTGYSGDTTVSNAQMNAKLALELGVKAENIIINPEPKDTKEEALFIKSLLGGKAFVLVTSASHMPRSMRVFKSVGLNPIAAPTDFYKEEFKGYIRAPNIGSLSTSRAAVHEYIGILWSMLKK